MYPPTSGFVNSGIRGFRKEVGSSSVRGVGSSGIEFGSLGILEFGSLEVREFGRLGIRKVKSWEFCKSGVRGFKSTGFTDDDSRCENGCVSRAMRDRV